MKMHSVHRKPKKDGVCSQWVCVRRPLHHRDDRGRRAEPRSSKRSSWIVYGDEPLLKILLERMGIRIATFLHAVASPHDPRAITDSITHRGQDVEGYRGVPLR